MTQYYESTHRRSLSLFTTGLVGLFSFLGGATTLGGDSSSESSSRAKEFMDLLCINATSSQIVTKPDRRQIIGIGIGMGTRSISRARGERGIF